MIHVDLVIVYNEIVMNSKLQLENPISNAEAMPGNDIRRTLSFQCNVILVMPVVCRYIKRNNDANKNLMIK